jgi:hypothetical protein
VFSDRERASDTIRSQSLERTAGGAPALPHATRTVRSAAPSRRRPRRAHASQASSIISNGYSESVKVRPGIQIKSVPFIAASLRPRSRMPSARGSLCETKKAQYARSILSKRSRVCFARSSLSREEVFGRSRLYSLISRATSTAVHFCRRRRPVPTPFRFRTSAIKTGDLIPPVQSFFRTGIAILSRCFFARYGLELRGVRLKTTDRTLQIGSVQKLDQGAQSEVPGVHADC